MESISDKLSRLEMMADPKQGKWDLSENDQAAISTALSLIRNYVPEERILEDE